MRFALLSLALVLSLALPALAARNGARRKPPSAKPQAPASGVVDGTVPSYADRVAIHYHAEGHGTPAVVLIHCWACDTSDWDNQVPVLAKTHRVVTLDLAGHGRSGTERKAWTMPAFGADVKTVVEQLRLDKVVLVGHSMGGYVMLEAARIMPERVLGLVAVDTLHDADRGADAKEREAFMAAMRADFRGQSEKLVRMIIGRGAAPAVVDKFVQLTTRLNPEAGLAMMEDSQRYDIAAAFKRVGVPVVAINSTMFPTNVEGNRKYLKKYEVLYLPDGIGHYPQYECPDVFNGLLERTLASIAGK